MTIILASFAIAIGMLFLVSALANWEWYHALFEFELTVAIFGENAARIQCMIVGVLSVGLGIGILVVNR